MRRRYVLLPLLALASMTAAGATPPVEGAWGTPGTRLTRKAFWLDRRYPLVNRWRDPS